MHQHLPSALVILLLTIPAFAAPNAAPPDEAPAAYALATRLAVPLLPPELRACFEARQSDLIRSSAPPATGATATPATPPALRNERAHCLKLDVEAAAPGGAAGDAAARRFPRREEDAKALFQRLGERAGGELPWALREAVKSLAEAMRSSDPEAIVSRAGLVVHLATDAALPFNTTRDPDGRELGALHWPVSDAESGDALHHNVRARLHAGLLTRALPRLEAEARISPERLRVTGDPLAEIFETMLRAREACELLARMDADVTTSLGLTDAAGFAAGQEDYYRRMADRACWVMEARLEDGGLLAAGLLVHAWNEAGRPALPAVEVTRAPTAEGAGEGTPVPPPPPAEAGGFAASKKGKAFHRADCAHVKRITPDNIRRFTSAQEAVDAGFEACKACKPAG